MAVLALVAKWFMSSRIIISRRDNPPVAVTVRGLVSGNRGMTPSVDAALAEFTKEKYFVEGSNIQDILIRE